MCSSDDGIGAGDGDVWFGDVEHHATGEEEEEHTVEGEEDASPFVFHKKASQEESESKYGGEDGKFELHG